MMQQESILSLHKHAAMTSHKRAACAVPSVTAYRSSYLLLHLSQPIVAGCAAARHRT